MPSAFEITNLRTTERKNSRLGSCGARPGASGFRMDTFGAVKFPSWRVTSQTRVRTSAEKKNYGMQEFVIGLGRSVKNRKTGRTMERKNWTTERKKFVIGLLRWGRLPGREFDRPKWVHTESECPRTGSDQDQDPNFS